MGGGGLGSPAQPSRSGTLTRGIVEEPFLSSLLWTASLDLGGTGAWGALVLPGRKEEVQAFLLPVLQLQGLPRFSSSASYIQGRT